MIKLISIFTVLALLSGCTASTSTSRSIKSLPVSAQSIAAATVSAQQENSRVTRISECHSELEALKTFNPSAFQKHQVEFNRISIQTQKYLNIKKGLGNDINDLAMPKYQYSVRDLCFRIRTDLGKAMTSI